MQNYKDLKVWEKGHEFTLKIYHLTKNFPKEELYSLTNQIRRASSSIPANIAEGCGKNSQNDFAHFLNIALGSANEAEYFLILSTDLGYLNQDEYQMLFPMINEIKGMLISLIGKVRKTYNLKLITLMTLFDVYPLNNITITRAEGAYVWDDKGIKYLDMYGGHAVISIGHTHPHWVHRIQEQLNKIAFYSNSVKIPVQQQLAKKLAEVSGKDDYQLFLVNSGAEANENALKLASFHNGKKKIIAFSKSFHGRTSLAVAATDNQKIIAPVNETDNVIFLPFNNEQALEECFKKHGDEISSVIIEAIQGVGGINEASKSFLQKIRALCNRYNAVYIADSVQDGYGRSGEFFAHDYAEAEADIYTMAKGMGNGFPVGGILIAPHIHPKHGMLGTTFGGNHLACAAALAVLEVIESEDLIENAEKTGKYLFDSLKEIEEIKNVRGRGLMIGFDVPEELKDLKKNLLYNQHIFTGEAKPNVIRLLPSLAITRQQVDAFIGSLKEELAVVLF